MKKQTNMSTEKGKRKAREYHRKIKLRMFDMLGHSCVRCGFSDKRALQIDHIYGGGNKDWKIHGNSTNMNIYYLEHPEEAKQKLQILCSNCNWIKRYENGEGIVMDS